ncbi:LLM class flavin-dependent oxidoreductase [Frankia sp. AgB32]|uniref:LLM class flavin-dependent oxidoreductase n=1 Tax=Frankia sp. AgB32 TaxID=631119 RepID=UPI0024B0EC0E|nr:LLM class flavin-dependent oxidoreductase [Frankia sp. AgB32]
MEIFSFHLMPWPYLPADYGGSAWITVPNELYDPVRGHDLYNRYLDELEYAEQVGFDGLVVNEHHQTAYGSMPSPNLFAALLARRTSRAKIAVIGTPCRCTTRRPGWPRSSRSSTWSPAAG